MKADDYIRLQTAALIAQTDAMLKQMELALNEAVRKLLQPKA